jgi:hypothetical protein
MSTNVNITFSFYVELHRQVLSILPIVAPLQRKPPFCVSLPLFETMEPDA